MVKITWLGHATSQIEIADKLALIVPRLEGTPTESTKPSDAKRVDAAYVNHNAHLALASLTPLPFDVKLVYYVSCFFALFLMFSKEFVDPFCQFFLAFSAQGFSSPAFLFSFS